MVSPWFNFKYNVLSPLQDTWQIAKIKSRFPQMDPLIQAYQKRYPYSGSSATLSVDERSAKGIDDDTLTYGETRWTTFIEILDQLKLRPTDRFIDLGCGAGFLCLLASQGYGVQATGVDLIDGFIRNGKELVSQFNLERVDYRQGDIFSLDFMPYDVFYATCTCFPEDYMHRLAEKFRHVRTGSKIVTVTHELKASWLKPVKAIKCKYSWGPDWVYISERI